MFVGGSCGTRRDVCHRRRRRSQSHVPRERISKCDEVAIKLITSVKYPEKTWGPASRVNSEELRSCVVIAIRNLSLLLNHLNNNGTQREIIRAARIYV